MPIYIHMRIQTFVCIQLEAGERAPRLVVSGYWKLQRTLCRHASANLNGGVEIKGINLVKFASESSAYQTRVGIRMSRLARSPLSRSPEPTYGFGNARVHSTVYIVCPRHKAYTDRWPQALSGLAVAPPAQINNSIDSIRSNASSHYVASRQRQRPNRIVDKKKMQITPICRLFLILNSFPLSAVRRLTLAACSKDLNTRGKRLLS